MNLGKKYKQLFEGRKADYFDKLNEAPTPYSPGDYKIGKKFDADAPMASTGAQYAQDSQEKEPLDIEYYSDQLNKLMDNLRDFHQDLGTDVEMRGDESGDYQYETMEKQLSRYIMGAEKQLESLQKYLERQKGKGL
jgi:hypothetical protein